MVFLLGLFVSIIEKNGWIALIACVGVPLIIKFHPKEDDYKYTSSESYDDAHELAEKARRDHGQTSVLKAKSSSSACTWFRSDVPFRRIGCCFGKISSSYTLFKLVYM